MTDDRRESRIRRIKPPVFTYLCTNCRTKNKTETQPEDCMLHCQRCGFLTVQACVSAEGKPR